MTKDAVRAGASSGLSVAGWPLRRKLALALAIPLLLAATLGGMQVSSALAESSEASTSASQVTVLRPAVDYLSAAEAAMVAAQGNDTASEGDLVDAIDKISTTATKLEKTAEGANLTDRQSEQVAALLDLSQAMRSEDARTLGPATWVAQVRQLESSVNQLGSSINAAQNTPEPRLEQLSQAVSGRMSLAQQQALVANVDLAQSGSQELFSEIGVEASAIDRLAASLGEEPAVAELRSANTLHAGQIRDDTATDLGGRDAYLPYDSIIDKLVSGVASSLDAKASDARASAAIGALLTLGALAAAVFLAMLIARSLLDPIGRVREGALAVARHRLPDAVAKIRAGEEPEPIQTIDVTTNEEIGQVARAVDDLHRQALHLAAGEAQLRQTVNAMFVTLSRRSNSLVNQQLAQIERLEHDEEDPKRLESLFRLDHLASRMRRTADSLLILADAPNRAAGQFSLTVGETLQAATSGVQDYQRVQIMSHLGTRVSEEAAADVVYRSMPATPQYRWGLASRRLGTHCWLKHENHTPVGAFKIRGGLTFFDDLRRQGRLPRAVISATRGNHGQSVAWAARAHGVACTIVVPHGNSVEKNAAMRTLGAELVEHGDDFQASREHALAMAQETGALMVPSFHFGLVRGVATYWWEFFRAVPQLDVVYVPIGLGSGICAAIAAKRALHHPVRIVGVGHRSRWCARLPGGALQRTGARRGVRREP